MMIFFSLLLQVALVETFKSHINTPHLNLHQIYIDFLKQSITHESIKPHCIEKQVKIHTQEIHHSLTNKSCNTFIILHNEDKRKKKRAIKRLEM